MKLSLQTIYGLLEQPLMTNANCSYDKCKPCSRLCRLTLDYSTDCLMDHPSMSVGQTWIQQNNTNCSAVSKQRKLLKAHSKQLQRNWGIDPGMPQRYPSSTHHLSSCTTRTGFCSCGTPTKLSIILPEKYDGFTGKCKGLLMQCAMDDLACTTKCRENFNCLTVLTAFPSWKGS